MSRRRLLITGVHGFVGSNLTKALGEQFDIWGVDMIEDRKNGLIKTFMWNQLDQVPDVDVVIHLAGKAHDIHNLSDRQVYFDVNYGLTEIIFSWFLKSKASRFLFFSSVKAAAEIVSTEFLTEDVDPMPVGPYGESKLAAEKLLMSNLGEVELANKHLYIFRPAMIHGQGNKGNLTELYRLIKKRIPWPLGAFENKRSFTSIDNLIFILQKLILAKAVPSGIYNIADDEPLSTNQLVKLIGEAVGQKVTIWKISAPFITQLAKWGDTFKWPLNSHKLRKLTESYVVSNSKIKQSLEIDTLPVKSTVGILKTIKSFGV